jgi:aminopeptidase N
MGGFSHHHWYADLLLKMGFTFWLSFKLSEGSEVEVATMGEYRGS